MKLIISTIGTSLLTNGVTDDERKLLNSYSNHQEKDIPVSDLARINDLISKAEEKIKNKDLSQIQKYSAELNGIISYYDNQFDNNKKDNHLLITTDTYEGEKTAELVKNYLCAQDFICQVIKIEDMNTANCDDFQAGIKKLILYLYETIPGYREAKYEIVFNLTGGFKAIQAYMNTLGMFLADEIVYLFETGTIISIPRLPVKLDNRELMRKYATYFAMLEHDDRLLKDNQINPDFFKEVSTIYYNSEKINGEMFVELSAWGLLMWNENKKEIFQEELINYSNLVYTSKFKKSCDKIEQSDKYQLQDTLAKVAKLYLTNEISKLKDDGGIQYDNYTSEKIKSKPIGHFRVSRSLRVNCFEWKNELHLLEFGEHDIEDNLSKYKDSINEIMRE